jgi:hypothetical protein
MYASQQFVIIGKRCLESDKTAFLIAQNGRAIGWKDASELPDDKIEACVLAFSPPFLPFSPLCTTCNTAARTCFPKEPPLLFTDARKS